MKRSLFAIVITSLWLFSIPNYVQCQSVNIHDEFDKAKSSLNYSKLAKTISAIFDSWGKKEKDHTSPIEAVRQREIQNQIDAMSDSELLNHIDDSDYHYKILYDNRDRLMSALYNNGNILDNYKNDDLRKLIMEDPSLEKKVKDKIWEQKEKILELAKDSNIERLILSDPSLQEYYDTELKIHDIQQHPEKIRVYIYDPKMRQIIEDNPKLARILAQEIKKQYEEALQREQQRIIERENKKKKQQIEIQRLKDEGERAAEQETQNAQEWNNDLNLSHTLGSMMPSKQQNPPQNTVTRLQVSQEEYDELYEDPTLLNAKINCAVYNTKANVEKAWKTAKVQSKTVLKGSQNKIKGKLISIPVGKANEAMDNFFNTAWPNADMGTKVRVARDIYQEESNLASDILKCIVHEGVEAVSSGDMKQFNKCIQRAKNDFTDKVQSNLETLTHVKFRKYTKWLINVNQDDEEY